MAGNINIIHHSLNAGEVSPRMAARQDQNKYMAGCETMLNWVPLVLGGAYVRPGLQFVVETKTVANHPLKIMRPFVASRTAAYAMEIGHLYVRFFKDGLPLGAPLELVTPWIDADLSELFFVESIDVMYVLHGNYSIRKITRVAVDDFTITEVNFNPPATLEEEPTGIDLGMGTLTPDATSGSGANFTAASGSFLAADVGRIIVSGGSRAVINSIAGNVATGTIIDNFPDTNPIAADDWRLTLSPQTTLDITNDKKDIGNVVTLTAAIGAFRSADTGKWIALFGGLVQINSVNSATSLTVTIKATLKDIADSDPDPTPAWSLEVAAWSATLGFPTCGCFFQGRLWLCKGLTINGSASNDFENFAKGADADNAIAQTISDDDIDSIVWIKGDKTLKVGTGSGVFQCVATAQSGALTPTSFRVEPIDPNGGARIPPLRVSPILIYVDAGRRELRELSYSFAEDNFKSPHLFRFSEHLMEGFFINEIFYASSPDSIVYVVRNDGVLLGLVYEQVENVIAWFRLETDGDFMSGCRIPRPSTGKDWIWVIVSRATGTFVEYFEPDHSATGREWNDLHTDSAVVTTHDVNFLVTGGDHLEGRPVKVIGDGMLFEDAVITGGEFTLDPQVAVSKVEFGLSYDARIVPVEPAVQAEAGGPMIARGYSKIGIRIRQALGLTLRAYRVGMNEPGDTTIAGEQLTYRKPYHLMDEQVPLQRGKKCVLNLGYDPFSRIEVRQALPFPAEVLNVIGRLHVGDEWDCETYNDNEQFFIPPEPPPPPPPPVCGPFPGQQILKYERRFAQNMPDANYRAGWSYISPSEETYRYSGITNGCMPYETDPNQILQHYTSARPLGDPPVPTVPLVPFVGPNFCTDPPVMGQSDEPAYQAGLTLFYVNSGTYTLLSGGDLAPFGGWGSWAKGGNELFVGPFVFHGGPSFRKFDVSGTLLQTNTADFADTDTYTLSVTLTSSFVYVLLSVVTASPAHQFIFKFARSNILTLLDTFELGDISANQIYAVTDDLIYIGAMAENGFDETSHRLYYWDGQLRYVGFATPLNPSDPGTGLTPFGQTTSRVLTFGAGLSESKYFYWGSSGFAGFDTDVYRMGPMLCTDTPIIPSVSGPDSGVIDTDIEIDWADILEPDATDYIQLLPVADIFSFPTEDHITVERVPTDGTANGALTFHIPVTFTAGSYRIWLGAAGSNIMLAKGNLITII